jgi:hypothetical protein
LVEALYAFTADSTSGILNLGGAETSSRAQFGRQLAEYFGFSTSLLTETSYVGKLQGPRPRDVTLDLRRCQSILSRELQPLTLAQGFAKEWHNHLPEP